MPVNTFLSVNILPILQLLKFYFYRKNERRLLCRTFLSFVLNRISRAVNNYREISKTTVRPPTTGLGMLYCGIVGYNKQSYEVYSLNCRYFVQIDRAEIAVSVVLDWIYSFQNSFGFLTD